jgi:hypothetical protein
MERGVSRVASRSLTGQASRDEPPMVKPLAIFDVDGTLFRRGLLPELTRRLWWTRGLLREGAEGAEPGLLRLSRTPGLPRELPQSGRGAGLKGAEERLRRGATRAYGAEVEGGLKSYSQELPIGHKTTQGLPYLLRTVMSPLVSRRMMWWSRPRALAVG